MSELEKFILSRWAYSVGQPFISDAEYNMLLSYMKEKYPDNEYVNRSWSSDPCPRELLIKYNMEHLIHSVMLTDRTESIESLNTWTEVEREFLSLNEEATISYKLDGWNIQFSYYNGHLVSVHSRGRSSDYVDYSNLKFNVPKEIPIKGKVTVVTEAVVSNAAFEFCKEEFGNVSQRGAVSTLLARPEYTALIEIIATNLICDEEVDHIFFKLRSMGFKVPEFYNITNYEELLEHLKLLSDREPEYYVITDGVVVKSKHKTRAIRLLAWEQPVYQSYVKGYREEFGDYRISVQCDIFPIKLQNSTQRKVPLTNLKRIVDMNLQIGSPIAFKFVSGAIADVDEDMTRLLHKQWEGRWEDYQMKIKQEEEIKRLL